MDRMERRRRVRRGEEAEGCRLKAVGVGPNTQDTPPAVEPEIPETDFLAFPAVTHQPAHCPNCGSARNHIYKTGHPTQDTTKRYHICQGTLPDGKPCPAKFRSLEELNRVDFVAGG